MPRISLLACLALLGGACTGSDSDSETPDINLADAGPGDAGPNMEPDAAPAMSCTDEADFNSCAGCFAMQNPDGSSAYGQAIVSSCYCANECAADCMSGCADPSTIQQGDACDTCLNQVTGDQNSACVQGFGTACQANPSCLSFATSLQSCQ